MVTVNIDDMQRDLAGYLHRVQAGETLVVLEADRPLAEIKPYRDFVGGTGEPRPFGLCAGEFVVPDDFDAPLPEDILQDFERVQGNCVELKFYAVGADACRPPSALADPEGVDEEQDATHLLLFVREGGH